MRPCVSVAMSLFTSAMVGLAAPFGDGVFLVGGHMVLLRVAVMLRTC
jgi:hypothetical protein